MKINELKGIGEKTEKLFGRLGIETTDDLMNYYPRSYDVYTEPSLISDIGDEGVYAIWGTVVTACEMVTKGRFKILSVYVSDDSGQKIKLSWFNMQFLRNELKRGYKYIFRGKVAFRGSLVFMEQPVIYTYEKYKELTDRMQPVYRLTEGVTNNLMVKTVKQCFQLHIKLPEYLPDSIISSNALLPRDKALYMLHFPANYDELKIARKRIVFDEFFLYTLSMRSARTANLIEDNSYKVNQSDYSKKILESLPYELTNAQKKVYQEILSDMGSNKCMNRLIQGDVGSGKTILAMLAMVDICKMGYQSALMAPTEVLAKQHYENFTEILEQLNIPVKCVLLTGSMTASAKRQAQEDIMNHNADIIIGTHALITDKVQYAMLGLVITDEQHRFGVRQREVFMKKGCNPHVIVMSATPIPRSLAIILYGDLDISILNEKPAKRLDIKNCVVDESYHTTAYKFILDEIRKDHQAYIICAMAEESEEDDNTLKNVVEYSEKLKEIMPADVRIEYLHGKLKGSVKTDIMNRFAEHSIDILVSTTVVEVGINVPNATVMMIENAERFGLAGLHQLRGRVGRGKSQSYCIFVSNTKNPDTKKRLMLLKESNDGFYIAEQDLKMRGPGDILGTRQSGDMNFQLGDIYTDAETLKLASDTASKLLEEDSTLDSTENAALKKELTVYMNEKMERLNI